MRKIVNPGWAVYSVIGIIIFIACMVVGVVLPAAGGQALSSLQIMIIVEMTAFILLTLYLLMIFSRSYTIDADGLSIWYFGIVKKHYSWENLKIVDVYEEKNGNKYIRCLPEKSDMSASYYGFRHPFRGICFKHNEGDAKLLVKYARQFSYRKHR